ncbi:hypothetical protein B0H10DRAFT_1959221 [Mycena sp. CBHHK59/15]|nr:hypothetical protein B0H10DRAFT_1959221 [Mycena sp. CBHHK59/15]
MPCPGSGFAYCVGDAKLENDRVGDVSKPVSGKAMCRALRYVSAFLKLDRDGHGYGFGYKRADPDPNPQNPNPNPRVYGLATGLGKVCRTRRVPAGFGSEKMLTRDPYPSDPTRKPAGFTRMVADITS